MRLFSGDTRDVKFSSSSNDAVVGAVMSLTDGILHAPLPGRAPPLPPVVVVVKLHATPPSTDHRRTGTDFSPAGPTPLSWPIGRAAVMVVAERDWIDTETDGRDDCDRPTASRARQLAARLVINASLTGRATVRTPSPVPHYRIASQKSLHRPTNPPRRADFCW